MNSIGSEGSCGSRDWGNECDASYPVKNQDARIYIYMHARAHACPLLCATVLVQAVQKSGSATNSVRLVGAIAEHKSNSKTYSRFTRSNLHIVNSNSSLMNIKITITKIPKNYKEEKRVNYWYV